MDLILGGEAAFLSGGCTGFVFVASCVRRITLCKAAERFRKGDFSQRYAAGERIVADGSEGGRERDGSQPLVLRKGGLADGCHSFGNDGDDGVGLQRAHEAVGFDLVDGGSFSEKSEADAEMGALVGHIVDGEGV